MLSKFRDKLRNDTRFGAGVGVVAVLVTIAVGVLVFRSALGGSEAARHNAGRVYICAETGKPFPYTVKPGTKIMPVRSPHSGKDTGYPAQHCYWTADGKVKKEPTYVLMNAYKGEKGPTFCPDCNRLVPADNPVVADGSPPPPTQDEYMKRRANKRQAESEREGDL